MTDENEVVEEHEYDEEVFTSKLILICRFASQLVFTISKIAKLRITFLYLYLGFKTDQLIPFLYLGFSNQAFISNFINVCVPMRCDR